jgi:hypothetical protein
MIHLEQLDIDYLRPLRDALSAFTAGGWTATDNGRFIRLSGRIQGAPIGWDGIGVLAPFVNFMMARGERRGDAIELHQVNGTWEFLSLPDLRPEDWFSDADQVKYARRAWESQTSSLAHLDLEWTVKFDLDLGTQSRPDVDLQVHWDPSYIDHVYSNDSNSELSTLVPSSGRRVHISLQGDRSELEFGALTFVSLDAIPKSSIEIHRVPEPLSGESDLQPQIAKLLHVSGDETSWRAVSVFLLAAACASIWSAVSSVHTKTNVEFFGYKRVNFDLPVVWAAGTVHGALRLREWTFSEKSADRLLALRQIISLYTEPPFDYVDEILESADPIYFALRSDATAEALRDTRDAESHAQQAVRLSAQGAVDLAKLAGERTLAGLVAVGAAAIANVTEVLDAEVTTTILGFIAGYFGLILALFLLVDRRAIALPIEQLESEIQRKVTYLSPTTIQTISESPTVLGARKLVSVTRIVVACIYGAIILALCVAIALRLA